MNLGQIRTAIQARGYGTDTATQQTAMVNAVYREIAGQHRWPWLEAQSSTLTTTIGDPDYATTGISADLMYIDAVRLTRGTTYLPLEYIAPQDFRDLEHVDRDNGEPIYWTYMNYNLRLWPRPDQVYTVTVDYLFRPTDLSADSDQPLFDATYHDVLVWGAIRDLAFRERDWSAKNFADAEYSARFGKMERAYGMKQRQNSSHVQGSKFWDSVGRTYGGF